MPRRSRSRGTLSYAKPPLHLDELVDRLADRGLHIPDRDRARRYLRHIGYYRLSPYSIPFQQGRSDHEFRSGTSFDDVLDLYVFDRALRLLVMDALERVEVAVRAALTDQLATRHADSHWYLTPGHFQDRRKHTQLLQMIERTCDSQLLGIADAGQDHLVHRSALEHYVTTYGSPALPPSWLMVETLTIECLPQPPGAPRPHRCRRQRRSNRTRTGVLADDLRACPQHLCSPRSAVECRSGCHPSHSGLADDLVAADGQRSPRGVQEASLPRARVVAVRAGRRFPAQQLGPTPARSPAPSPDHEPLRHGSSAVLGIRPVLEPAPRGVMNPGRRPEWSPIGAIGCGGSSATD